jgi:hypothetical protein
MDLPGILSYRVERLKFKATNLDLGLALIATFLMPVACWLLLDWSGALLPLILYYGVFCVAIVLWRKKSLDYVRPVSWSFKLFIGLLALQIFIQTIAYLTIIPVNDPWEGVLLTLLIWVPHQRGHGTAALGLHIRRLRDTLDGKAKALHRRG